MRTFAKHTFITGVTQVASFGLGLLTSLVIARGLGPDGKGIYTLTMSVPALLVTLCHLGIQWATVYYVAQRMYPMPEILGSNVWLAIWLGIGSTGLGVILLFFFGELLVPGVPQGYLFIALLAIPAELFFSYLQYMLLGAEHIPAFNLINILQKGVALLFLIILVWFVKAKVVGAITAALISWIITNGALLLIVKRISGGIVFIVNRSYVKASIIFGIKSHIGNIFWFLTHRLDVFLVNGYLGPAAVGYYSLSVALGESLWMISQAASTVLLPRIAGETDENRRRSLTPVVARTVILTTALLAIAMAVFSPWLIRSLYSEAFLPSVWPLQGLLPGIVALSAGRVLANDITGRGYPLLNTYIVGGGLVVNIVLNVLLIPICGILGAAIASSASYILIFIIRLFFYCRLSGNRWTVVVLPQRGDWIMYRSILKVLGGIWKKTRAIRRGVQIIR